ncbi:hypothetical protein BHM03_00051150 [Ensete ventricosum]|nr:hypothetical protein BHM03_00051150 [Ensete ventricosum]
MAEIDRRWSILAVPPGNGWSAYWLAVGPVCTGRYGSYCSVRKTLGETTSLRFEFSAGRAGSDSNVSSLNVELAVIFLLEHQPGSNLAVHEVVRAPSVDEDNDGLLLKEPFDLHCLRFV